MTKMQVASVIGWLPIIPFVGKGGPVKAEIKAEPRKSEPTMTAMTAVLQEVITETPNITRPEETTVVQVLPRTSPAIKVNVDSVEVDIEKDAEAPQRVTEMTEELGTELEKADQYSQYVLSGKGDTPEQKINEAVKDLNYHNMVVVIAVGDKTINNIGSIRMVAEKWGLSFSVVQCTLSRIKEHRQGGRQYDKLAGRPQGRSRQKEDKSNVGDELDQEAPSPKKSTTGKGKCSRKVTEKEIQSKKPKNGDDGDDELPDVPM